MYIRENGIVREMTAEEISEYENLTAVSKEQQIENLKQNLADTDYKAIKYAEGQMSEQEYEAVKLQRQAWRDEINQLESEEI